MKNINLFEMSKNDLDRYAKIAKNNPDCFLSQKELLKILGHIKYQQYLINNKTLCEKTLVLDSNFVGKLITV